MPCLFKSAMHHTCLCIMPCVCGDCLLCCLFLSGLLLSLASVSLRSCEDSFDYVRLSSSWTHSSSLGDFRQVDRYPGSHYYHCYASCFVLSLCCATYSLALQASQIAMNLWPLSPFLANHCLAKLPLLLSPSYSVASCRWSWRFLHGGQVYVWDITISLILLMHLYTW